MIGIGWLLDQAVSWLQGVVRDTFNDVWKLLAATVFHVPDVTGLAQVRQLAARSLLVVNTMYVLAILAVAIAIMAGSSVQMRYGAGELVPRLVIGLVLANFATPVCLAMITGANALVIALTGEGIASPGSLGQLQSLILAPLDDAPDAVLGAVIGVVLVVLVVMLIVGWISRFFWLIVLCGVSPVALACHGTPWTDGAARLWWRSIGGICLTVVLQALAMNTSLSLLLTPQGLARYGLPSGGSGLLSLLLVVVLLWITARIPALVRRNLAQGGGRPNIMSALIRLVIAQQVTRGLATVVRAATTRAAVTGAAHRGAGTGRHVRGRTTGDPLRGFRPRQRPALINRRTGQPVPLYTPLELAEGVDLFTRAMRRRAGGSPGAGASGGPPARTPPGSGNPPSRGAGISPRATANPQPPQAPTSPGTHPQRPGRAGRPPSTNGGG